MITLVEINDRYISEIESFKSEILVQDKDNEDRFAGCLGLEECNSAAEWVELCKLRKTESTCKMTGVEVPSTTYMAIRECDNRIVGIIDLRHHINHPILGAWGGHCGYCVRPSERHKGYAKEMLGMNIQNAKDMGILRMLITCNESNVASERIIMANGGVYENSIEVDGCLIKRYWIETEGGIIS